MKYVILVIGFVFCQISYSQDYYTKEFLNTDVFEETEMPAVLYNLQNVKIESFKKEWKIELKENTKEDVIVTDFQVIADNVLNTKVSNVAYKVFANFKSTESGVEFIVAFRDSASAIDFQSDVRQIEINTYLDAFVTRVYVKSLNGELNEEKAELKKLNNEVEKVEKNIAKKEKQTMKLKAQIEQTEQQIVANKSQYETLLKSLETKRTELAGTSKKSDGYDSIKKEVKGLEKNKKNMESQQLKDTEFIYDSEATIENNASLVKEMEENVILLDLKIKDQKAIVIAIEEELYKLNRP